MSEQSTNHPLKDKGGYTGEFYPIPPEDNIPVHYHNDMNRHLSLRRYDVEIDTITGNQIVIISKKQ